MKVGKITWIKIFSYTLSFKQYGFLSILVISLGLIVFFSRENSPRIKDGAYVINLHDKQRKEIH